MRLWRTLILLLAANALYAAEFLVYAGTSTAHGSKGIYAWRFQTTTGKLTPLGVAAETGNPSFLVEHPNHKFLYAVNENGGAGILGSVSAYAIDTKSGKLSPLNWVSSKGGSPCRLAIDHTGKWLAVVNDAGGSVAVLPILADGRLGDAVAFDQRAGAHPHDVLFSPDNRHLAAAGLGIYAFDAANGSIAAVQSFLQDADHLAFHPDGSTLYAVSEKSSTVTAFQYDGMQPFQTLSTLPDGLPDVLAVNAAGTVLYVANRAANALSQFAIDPDKHSITPMEYPPVMGKSPRHIALDPTGAYLFSANQDSANLTIFRVHPHTGQLQPASAVAKNVPNPTCVVFVPLQANR